MTRTTPGTVAAVVVTRNRRALLEECLRALHEQTHPPQRVFVVDNASTDGTAESIRAGWPQVELIELDTNQGGAGGFHEGMRAAHAGGYDWVWLMDDDTIAQPGTLTALLGALDRIDGLPEPAILASKVVWTDGDLHPKNLPFPRVDDPSKPTLLAAASAGLVLIRATTFVSILVSRRAIDAHGFPHKHYFIWGDDGEYTARVLRNGAGYLVPDSVVLHKTPQKESVHAAGSPQYYYEVRNKLFMLRGQAWDTTEKIKLAVGALVGIVAYLRRSRLAPGSLAVVARAVKDGLIHPAR